MESKLSSRTRAKKRKTVSPGEASEDEGSRVVPYFTKKKQAKKPPSKSKTVGVLEKENEAEQGRTPSHIHSTVETDMCLRQQNKTSCTEKGTDVTLTIQEKENELITDGCLEMEVGCGEKENINVQLDIPLVDIQTSEPTVITTNSQQMGCGEKENINVQLDIPLVDIQTSEPIVITTNSQQMGCGEKENINVQLDIPLVDIQTSEPTVITTNSQQMHNGICGKISSFSGKTDNVTDSEISAKVVNTHNVSPSSHRDKNTADVEQLSVDVDQPAVLPPLPVHGDRTAGLNELSVNVDQLDVSPPPPLHEDTATADLNQLSGDVDQLDIIQPLPSHDDTTADLNQLSGDVDQLDIIPPLPSHDDTTVAAALDLLTANIDNPFVIPQPPEATPEQIQNCLTNVKCAPVNTVPEVNTETASLDEPPSKKNTLLSKRKCAITRSLQESNQKGKKVEADNLCEKDISCHIPINELPESQLRTNNSSKSKRKCFSFMADDSSNDCFKASSNLTVPAETELWKSNFSSDTKTTEAVVKEISDENKTGSAETRSVHESLHKQQATETTDLPEKYDTHNLVTLSLMQKPGVSIAPKLDLDVSLNMLTGKQNDCQSAEKGEHEDVTFSSTSTVGRDTDITDSQLCEAVIVQESNNQLMIIQEVQKRHHEGRKIIRDLIVDLSYLNKLLLRTKREIETARRMRQSPSGAVTKNGNIEQFRY